MKFFINKNAIACKQRRTNEEDLVEVVLMTMHSAKGLEFPYVFLSGFEDGLFPGMRAIGDREEMEEERRLCYVAITRAKLGLTISYAKQRMLYGRTNASLPSRFLSEIPEDLVVRKGSTYTAYGASGAQRATQFKATPFASYKPSGELQSARSAPTQKPLPDWKKGDMVQHTAFGKGMILSVMKMGGDALLEIAFDEIGTKKLMAKTASAHMKQLW